MKRGLRRVKRKAKQKVPAVSTSQWQEYYREKEKRKKNWRDRQLEREKQQKREKNNDVPETTTLREDFQRNDFVIVMYSEQYYPGKIISIKTENKCSRYKFTHMEKKGINWYWPEKIDVSKKIQ